MLVNLTPHPVVFEDGRTLPKCDNPPRLAEVVEPAGEIDGVPIVRKSFDVDGCELPPPHGHHEEYLDGDVLVTNDVDHGYVVGEQLAVADCGGFGHGDERISSVCRCDQDCHSGSCVILREIRLLENTEKTYYIVPLLIAQAFRGRRDDLLVTNDPIRDEQGRIVGCRSLARV